MTKHSFTIILLIFIIKSHCGVIDNVIGTVKDTTSAVKQDIGSLWSYGSGLIFGPSAKDAKDSTESNSGEKRGFISGVYHSVHDKVHSLRERIYNVFVNDTIPSDNGLFVNMFDKVKNKVTNIKGSILGDHLKEKPFEDVNNTNQSVNDETKVIREGLDKLFFSNHTRKVHGQIFKDVVDKLRKKLADIRNNATEVPKDKGNNELDDGSNEDEGMIDIRSSFKEAVNQGTDIKSNDELGKM